MKRSRERYAGIQRAVRTVTSEALLQWNRSSNVVPVIESVSLERQGSRGARGVHGAGAGWAKGIMDEWRLDAVLPWVGPDVLSGGVAREKQKA